MDGVAIINNVKQFGANGVGVPIAIVLMLAMMILPLPPFMLDILFTFNISLGLMVLLATIYCRKPLDFAIFPTVLLITTLLRLSLNIASTRVVLLNGHIGTHAAGQVVKSFGEVVVGGNYTVGLVVFAILVVINFVVVTKGAGRVSEVSARFTLDAMPGKQMAIDADLNSGLITQDEARARRLEVAQEADFYGAMDGASKFVRGDAIAGILILFINILGGLFIGVAQHDMSFSDAAHNYALLTIGDGLVAQVPSLLLSISAAIIVTRVSKETELGGEVVSQVLSNPRALGITGGVIAILGVIPGMPHMAFLSFASLFAAIAYFLQERQKVLAEQERIDGQLEERVEEQQPGESTELSWDDVQPVETLSLEVGFRLTSMVDKQQQGDLLSRIKGVRKKLSQELGFLVPAVHVRDNLILGPNTYRISLAGVVMGEANIYPGKFLAINPGQVFGALEGVTTKDPAFGLEAVWVEPEQKEYATSVGYTVVDDSTVIATHLSHIAQTHAQQLLGFEETQKLLEKLSASSPKLAELLVPEILPLSVVVKVLQQLLSEGVPIRDMRTIVATLAEAGLNTKEPEALCSAVRVALRGLIVQTVLGNESQLSVLTLKPDLEQLLQNSLQAMGEGSAALEPGIAETLQQSLSVAVSEQEMKGLPAVLLVQPMLRPLFAYFAKQSMPSLKVLSFQEIPDDRQVNIVATVG